MYVNLICLFALHFLFLILTAFIKQTESQKRFGRKCYRYKHHEIPDVSSVYGYDRLCMKHNNYVYCKWWKCAATPKSCLNRSPGNNCLYCAGTCNLLGKVYQVGETLMHPDGQNICICGLYNRVTNCSRKSVPIKMMCNFNPDRSNRKIRKNGERKRLKLMSRNNGRRVQNSKIRRGPGTFGRPVGFAFPRRRGNGMKRNNNNRQMPAAKQPLEVSMIPGATGPRIEPVQRKSTIEEIIPKKHSSSN